MQVWKAQGDIIMLMMDANEHGLTGPFCYLLTYNDSDLDLLVILHRA